MASQIPPKMVLNKTWGHPWRLPKMPGIKELLKLYNIRAIKALSQNFLLKDHVCKVFLNACGTVYQKHVIEIGPGPGGITRRILHGIPYNVYTIEKDDRFRPMLNQMKSAMPKQLSLYFGDIMTFPMDAIIPTEIKKNWDEEQPNIAIIGNLPFSITSPLLFKFMKEICNHTNIWSFGRVPLTLSFQKEFGERMIAGETNKQRGRLSIMCQNYCNVHYKYTIYGKHFVPKVDVDVAVMKLEPRIEPIIKCDFDTIEKVVGALFRSKNKAVRHNFHLLFPKQISDKCGKQIMDIADVNPGKKAVELSVEEFGRIIYAYKGLQLRNDVNI